MSYSREIAVHLFKTEVVVYKWYLLEGFKLQYVLESLNLTPIFLSVDCSVADICNYMTDIAAIHCDAIRSEQFKNVHFS